MFAEGEIKAATNFFHKSSWKNSISLEISNWNDPSNSQK